MARLLVVFAVLGTCKSIIAQEYVNHTLVRLIPQNAEQLKAVIEFKDPDGNVEVLKQCRGLNDSMDVLVPPGKLNITENFTKHHQIMVEMKESYGRRFQEVSDDDRTARRRVFQGNPAFVYHSYNRMMKVLERLEKVNGNVLTVQTVGTSTEGRPLKLAKISTNPAANNPIIFIDAGIHAREWVAPAMALYLINQLSSDPTFRADLDGVDWYILPLVNPDGYEYTRTQNRMWRKTRSRNPTKTGEVCYGVDGNRNYGYKWAVSGVSRDPCNKETFAGPRPFSEPETRIVSGIMQEHANRIKLYVSLHSYGQYLVYPWGYTGEALPKSWKKLDRMAKIASQAVVDSGGPPFRVLSAGKWYPAAGGSDDFAFSLGIPYSYTMELTDGYEFNFPEEKLASTLPKLFQGFRAMAREIRNEFSSRRIKRDLMIMEMQDMILEQNLAPVDPLGSPVLSI